MKAYHNTFEAKKIKKFCFSKLGTNTWGNASQFIYAFTSLIGPWFSTKILDIGDFAHEYEIDDYDFMVVEDNEELVTILSAKLAKYDFDEWEMMERKSLYKCRKIAKEIREEFLEETYTGIWIKNDKEFGGESLIVFDISKIK